MLVGSGVFDMFVWGYVQFDWNKWGFDWTVFRINHGTWFVIFVDLFVCRILSFEISGTNTKTQVVCPKWLGMLQSMKVFGNL